MLRELTPAMCRALRSCQPSLLDEPATVTGHGMTMRGLRDRGLIAGAMPFARLTPFGRDVLQLLDRHCSNPAPDSAAA